LLAAVITVNSTADSDVRDDFLTLREALRLNNRTLSIAALSAAEKVQVVGMSTAADADTIEFNIPAGDAGHVYYRDDGAVGQVTLGNVATTTAADDASIADIDPDWPHSWFSIRPTDALQSQFDPVTINGYSQPGAQENTNPTGQGLNTVLRIEISGQNINPLFGGLVSVEGGSGSAIRGVVLNRSNGNGQNGALVNLWGSSANAVVQGNFLGTDVSGTQAFMHSYEIYAASGGHLIGGTAPAARNLISGSSGGALFLRGLAAPSLVQGNLIGTDRIGTKVLGNASGVIVDSPNNTIGGADPQAGNVIAGSIKLSSSNANFTLIQNNKLGTDPTGTLAIGAGGVAISNTASNNRILNNIIANGTGVTVADGSTGNLISQNSIYSNNGIGLDLRGGQFGGNGVNLNDVPPATNPPDTDTGANGLQNFPILSAVTAIAGGTRIEGTLSSTPNSNFRLEFFANPERDEAILGVAGGVTPGQFSEGQTYIGMLDVATPANGVVSFTVDLPVDLLALPGAGGQPFVTATATDVTLHDGVPRNNTSELGPVAPLGGPSFVATSTRDTGLGTLREAIFNANLTPGLQTITFAIPPNDSRHFYYRNDGVAGEVSLDHVAVTAAASEAAIADIDPDWPYSWFSIQLSRDLPEIIDTVVIDGYSQAGSRPNTLPPLEPLNTVLKVELDGGNASGDGLSLGIGGTVGGSIIDAAHSTIQGLAINRFGGNGIKLDTLNGNNLIAGNFIGTDVTGTIAMGNGANGILLRAEANSAIGGSERQRNLISGNDGSGVELVDPGDHLIEGNLIGSDRTDAIGLVNGMHGIFAHNSATSATGAGGFPGDPSFSRVRSRHNRVVASFDFDPGALPRAIEAVVINWTVFLAHKLFTVVTIDELLGVFLGLPFARVNPQALAIDIGLDGVTPNDLGDADVGQNGLQNFPVLTSAATQNGQTKVTGTINSLANQTFLVTLYSNSQRLPSGHGPGENILGGINVTTDSQGNTSFAFDSPELVPAGMFITATATRLDSALEPIETSEFSQAIIVNPALGDYNASGTVDAADYVVWRKALGQMVAPFVGADGSGNGVVDQADYDVWRARFGLSGSEAATSALAAEPTTGDGGSVATAAAVTTQSERDRISFSRTQIAAGLPPFAPSRRSDIARTSNQTATMRSDLPSTTAPNDEPLVAWLAIRSGLQLGRASIRAHESVSSQMIETLDRALSSSGDGSAAFESLDRAFEDFRAMSGL
jgi:hypothetical protein